MSLGHLMRGTEGGSQMRKSVLVWTAALLTVGAIGRTDTGREWR